MSRLQSLKAFVNQRLTAAVEEIFGHFERTITEFEEELSRRCEPRDVQQLSVSEEEQQQPEPPHIKEEKEEVWSSQEEADISQFPVKSEDDEEEAQSQTEENRETEPLSSSSAQHMKMGADGDHCGGNSHADDQTSDSYENNLGLNVLNNSECEKSWSCYEHVTDFSQSSGLKTHVRTHTGEKPFSCTVCGERFVQKVHLAHHMVHHTGGKLFSCTFCDESFSWLYQLRDHRCVGENSQRPEENRHTESSMETGGQLHSSSHPHTVVKTSHCSAFEPQAHGSDAAFTNVKKPFSFSDCAKTLMRCQAGEKPFSCLVCKKNFSWRRQLKRHMRIHTEEKNPTEQRKESFICTECGRRFVCKTYLKGHMRIHAGEVTNSCSVCGKCFVLRSHLNEHMRSHTGERPFSCQVCHKLFRYSGNLWRHMKIHSREKLLRGTGSDTQERSPGSSAQI